MNALTEKRYLTLPEPSGGDALAARERLLAALPSGCRLTLGCMQRLYPVLHEADYRVTVTLCPGTGGTDVVRVEPGDTPFMRSAAAENEPVFRMKRMHLRGRF